jgi:hypothetical protein
LGHASYPTRTYGEEDQIEKDVICSIAAIRGKFYFGCSAKEKRVIDFSSHDYPVLTAITIDDTVTPDGSYGYSEQHPCRIFLVESDGELYMVRLLFVSPYEGGDEMDRVGVHKMDFSRRRWCRRLRSWRPCVSSVPVLLRCIMFCQRVWAAAEPGVLHVRSQQFPASV